MSRDITVQWYRGGSDAGHRQSSDLIAMQLDTMSMQEAAYYQGTQPYFLFHGFVNSLIYAFQYQDLLINPNEIDPKTNKPAQYRIVSEPKVRTLSNYVLLVLNKVVGT